ncbi:probable C-mannosyltransferase DPY19L3 isoform X2 [Bombina bombina]|uniref:probable C-mannosyltransferase DPY19L3 isoform X2 n=1 Tax=Bombina bombina TaxID=8345 RepID=UPI00235A9889|nr:probable C-mannosyltransferase DPY19L3 isoform X2 [Bombina bombina]
MTTVRQRKRASASEQRQNNHQHEKNAKHYPKGITSAALWKVLSHITGGTVSLSLGLFTAYYVCTLHENDLWFSSIKEIEREISFRTECGLYYSYYKQMLHAPSIKQGITELIYDNKTESMRTINILERMNVYQEVFLAVLYRVLPFWNNLEPVYFYIYTLFGLQTMYVSSLFLTSWLLSGTWFSGLLAALWYIVNRIDTTRVEFTIPLRENWALPFFSIQIAGITYLLRSELTALREKMTMFLVFISTFIFSLTWQFNQFVLLIQALVLFVLDCVDLIPTAKVTRLYLMQVICLLMVCVLQFFNSMILGSLLLSFVLAVIIVRCLQKNLKSGGLIKRVWSLVVHVFSVLCLTVLINKSIKKLFRLQSDEHIFKFIQAKLGFGKTRDFDASLYLCEEAFRRLPLDTFDRFADTLLLYPYIFVLFTLIIAATVAAFNNLSWSSSSKTSDKKEKRAYSMKPEIAYNLMHSILFGCLALSTMRMKYLWTSHMCVMASFGLFSMEVWGTLLKTLRLYTPQRTNVARYSVSILVIVYLIFKFWPRLSEELSELREFYDPDTVQLMSWIKSNTPNNAVFAGSMQLLAGVKLCTGRVLTNHPHYEDKTLRERTKKVYQVYAKRAPEDVHSILRSFGTDYVILEDSICYERRHSRGCRLRDLLDVSNGHVMDGLGDNDPDLKPSSSPRFCEEIKKDLPSYLKYFTRVFKNKTFHVYRLSRKAAVK